MHSKGREAIVTCWSMGYSDYLYGEPSSHWEQISIGSCCFARQWNFHPRRFSTHRWGRLSATAVTWGWPCFEEQFKLVTFEVTSNLNYSVTVSLHSPDYLTPLQIPRCWSLFRAVPPFLLPVHTSLSQISSHYPLLCNGQHISKSETHVQQKAISFAFEFRAGAAGSVVTGTASWSSHHRLDSKLFCSCRCWEGMGCAQQQRKCSCAFRELTEANLKLSNEVPQLGGLPPSPPCACSEGEWAPLRWLRENMGWECSYLKHLGCMLEVSRAHSRPGMPQLAAGEQLCNHTPFIQDSFLCKDKPQMLVYMVPCQCASKWFLTTTWRCFRRQTAAADALSGTTSAFKIHSKT